MNQDNEEVQGEEEHSVAAAAPVGGGTNAPVQAMTFTRWMSMRLDTFDGSRMATDTADRPRTRWSGDGSWAHWRRWVSSQFDCMYIQIEIGIYHFVEFYLLISSTSKQRIWYCGSFPKPV